MNRIKGIKKFYREIIGEALLEKGHLETREDVDKVSDILALYQLIGEIRIEFPEFAVDLDKAIFDALQRIPKCQHESCAKQREEEGIGQQDFAEFHRGMNEAMEEMKTILEAREQRTSLFNAILGGIGLGKQDVSIIGIAIPKNKDEDDIWDDEIDTKDVH